MGDFNAHHPTWGGAYAASEPQSDHLLIETRRRELNLLTPTGLATWKRGRQESVIDLTFATDLIANAVVHCGPREDWAIGQDHIPIDIQLRIDTLPRLPSKQYALNKLRKDEFTQHISKSKWQHNEAPLQALQQSIQEGLDKYCPRASPSPRASRKWTPRASELLAGARRARCKYLASELPHHLQALRSHQNLLKKELCKSNRNMWCWFIGEATTSSDTPYNQGLWRLLRWSHSKASQPCLQMPPLHCRECHSTDLTHVWPHHVRWHVTHNLYLPPGLRPY